MSNDLTRILITTYMQAGLCCSGSNVQRPGHATSGNASSLFRFHIGPDNPASVLALLLATELLLAIGVVVHLHGILLSLAPAYSKVDAQDDPDRILGIDAAIGGGKHLHGCMLVC